jgi:gas vesicle protein GvpL/GvpF
VTGPEPRGPWAYAIAERLGRPGLPGLSGVGGGPVRTVESAGLTAVHEAVRLEEFGEAALRRNLEDLDWLDGVARAHHRVIDAVARQGPVVPMRLATVYRTEATLAGVLQERAGDFREALRRIGTRKEWGVKVYAAARPGSAPREPAAAPAGQAAAGSGAAYLRRRREQMSASKDTKRAAMASTQAVHDSLTRLAADTRLHPPQAPQLTGSKEPMLLNAAYLLDDAQSDAFAAAVAALAREHPGIKLEQTGPWPPYSFTGAQDQPGTAS